MDRSGALNNGDPPRWPITRAHPIDRHSCVRSNGPFESPGIITSPATHRLSCVPENQDQSTINPYQENRMRRLLILALMPFVLAIPASAQNTAPTQNANT